MVRPLESQSMRGCGATMRRCLPLAVVVLAGCAAPDPDSPAPGRGPDGLAARVSAALVDYRWRTNVEATVRLRNHGADPAWLLRPLLHDSSKDGRYMPAYVLTVFDSAGRQIP